MKNKILIILFVVSNLFSSENKLKKSFYFDLHHFQDAIKVKNIQTEKGKVKPIKAALFSAILPGSGEYLTENYYQSLFFLSAEFITLTSYFINDKKGNDQTTLFKNYADENWSVVKYAEWLNKNGAKYGDAASFTIDPNTNLNPWERVNWTEINRWESSTHTVGFTHVLPKHGEQQYFELIGKYLQYKYGWKSYQFNGDPLGDDNYSEDIPQEVKDYMAMRGKANDFYKIATYSSFAILVNHFASGLNAAWQANKFNQKIVPDVSYSIDKFSGKIYPKISLSVNF